MQNVVIYWFYLLVVTSGKLLVDASFETSDEEISHDVPVKVTEDGSFLTTNLTSEKHEELVHYRVTLDDRYHLLEMKRNWNFISPSMIVERRKYDNFERKALNKLRPECFFQGKVKGRQDTSVALAACNGLVGLIRTVHGIYYIEPLHTFDENSIEKGHKHKITKRSTQPKYHKNKRRKKRRRLPKNCGTREKKKITRLHWETNNRTLTKGKMTVKRYKELFNRSRMIHKRIRKSISKPHYVEVLLVADTSMVLFHEEWDLTTYLLTIMNMVSSLYMDPTIGNMIHIVVVKIILIEDPLAEPDLKIVPNSDKTLKSFCQWQKKINPENDSHPHHHDVAVLVTRKDMCSSSNSGCNTLGVAQVGSICSREDNCNVNEDNGIILAHTIAHEIGHNLGMYHDSERIGCRAREDVQHIMTPSFQAEMVGTAWSYCSRRDLTNFLDRGRGHCLHDKPEEVVELGHPELPPGALYDANYQCRLQFSVEATACSPKDEICSRLWCQVNNTCTTKLLPAAPGTSCGKHKWCQNQKCVDIMDPPAPVDGGWGEWGAWSECSRTCGAGVSISERKCDHPVPSDGGDFCLGLRRRYKMCNTEPCSKRAPSFRSTQCSFFNNHTYEGKKYDWLPYFEMTEPCKLNCIDTNNTVIMPLGDYAQDGTPCKIGTRDTCISGVCQKVGCDWVVGSNATEDECGICEGDNSKCNIFKGTYTKQRASSGYREVVVIPAGATNIKIMETNYSDNFISVGSALHKRFYLNGKNHISLPGEYTIAGSVSLYEKTPAEKITIPGPIEEMIVVLAVFVGKAYNPGIYYQYSLFKPELIRDVQYNWSYTEWSQCSVTCGGGIQEKEPMCKEYIASSDQYVLDGIATPVDEFYCEPNEKPKKLTRTCNDWLCQTHWWVGPWQSCPVTCIDKKQPTRKRSVMCVDGQDVALPDNFCDRKIKPLEYGPCETISVCD
ncbi:A disintegrin and metalloproteinase with thrombospondin motifs 12 isoform X1 [Harmonia axyridis]|uniref:A disintegrin and metalloproteinase with thrombospondin motifs 12 isoform X1 n=1 Tax=Harmonia axyridis TaxID=115357 RepID=UPI001E2771B0|nr:A disintegrin and metalloproteinase with thrombospondin motifs 12 isoform X1 [Harmonia axyridis]